jgi:gliding motility-associated protein GldM
MASGKLSPRQKMINMMYLVLIALLALNVSKDILKAFHMFDMSFTNANRNVDDKNMLTMKGLEENMADDKKRTKTEPFYKKALEVQKISKDLNDYIAKIKTDITTQAGGRKEPSDEEKKLGITNQQTELQMPDNMEKHANYFIPKGGNNGIKLQNKINETREQLLKVVMDVKDGKEFVNSIQKTTQLRADDPKSDGLAKKTWVSSYLEHAPLAGVVTLLTKTQNDCKSLESEILTFLASRIEATTIKFNAQMALILPEGGTNIVQGGTLKAKVALAAYDNTTQADMVVNGNPIKVENGLGIISMGVNSIGSQKLTAKIKSVDVDGNEVWLEAPPLEYTVYKPFATVSADAMNVLYIGLDNPMSISVPGVTASNTSVSPGPGLTLTKTGEGKYIAKVGAGARETSISVTATMPDGTKKNMGATPFRIKQVPKPEPQLGSLISGSYPKEVIQGQSFLNAALLGFVFDGVKFTVTKYRVLLVSKKDGVKEANGVGNNPAPIKNFASQARKGDIILVDGIYARGPSGDRLLNPLTFTIQ